MEAGSDVMDFFYDHNGSPYAVNYNGTRYYYITNLQGDVVRIVNAAGTSMGVYKYDAWGNILYSSNTAIINANPLRYRGYIYDTETEFYYLQSRYYDPAIGRFLNADFYASTGQNFLGYNMYAYCGNGPVIRSDPYGNMHVIVDGDQYSAGKRTQLELDILKTYYRLKRDIQNFTGNNTDVDNVFQSIYFSSYKEALVVRFPESDELSSFAIGGIIFLEKGEYSSGYKHRLLNHEYGHILQEKEFGTFAYIRLIAIPSVVYNRLSLKYELLNQNYYNMPWEYDADKRGQVDQDHAAWADPISYLYFNWRK